MCENHVYIHTSVYMRVTLYLFLVLWGAKGMLPLQLRVYTYDQDPKYLYVQIQELCLP